MFLSALVGKQIVFITFDIFQKDIPVKISIIFGILPLWFGMRAVTVVYNWTRMAPSERILVLKRRILSVNFFLCTAKRPLNNQ